MKRFFIIAALLLSAALGAQEIRSVDITLYIDHAGDAYIKQVWDVNVVSGTEWYLPIGNLGKMSIRGLTVQENGEEFIDEGRNWDSDRSLAEKAGRSGIIDKGSDGVELCWGQGSYGDHVWTSGFVALGLVQSLKDYDAFNFMLLNPDLIARPQKATVTITRLDGGRFDTDSTRVWFFGTEGVSEFREDGTIRFEVSNMRRDDSIICMMRFEKGMFAPEISRNIKFKKMQKKAFKGSSYKLSGLFRGLDFEDIIALLVGLLVVLGVVGLVLLFIWALIRDAVLKILGRTWKASTFGSTKVEGWAREAPFDGSIPIACALMKDGSRLILSSDHPERRIGAYFLKWIHEGLVSPIKAEDGHYDLKFPDKMPDFQDDCESNLFRKAMEASGSNMILEKGEFDSWAKKHYAALAGWPDGVVKEGRSKLSAFNGDKVTEAAKLLQFKNMLADFTLSRVREVPEVSLWGQYLVFAQLFGIADKVAAGFAKMYPTEFNDYSQRYGMDASSMRYVVRSYSSMASRAYNTAYSEKLSREAESRRRSSGGYGGYSSRGGGGGFSGGGRGGGSR